MPEIRLYTTQWCGYCVRARMLLEARGLSFEEVSLDDDPAFRQRVYDLGGRWTVPLVTIDGEPVGGYDELVALDRSGSWPHGSLRRPSLYSPRSSVSDGPQLSNTGP